MRTSPGWRGWPSTRTRNAASPRSSTPYLGYMEQLNEVSTENVEPTAHVFDLVNVFRADETDRSLAGDAPLSNAPETEQRFFVVPRIVE